MTFIDDERFSLERDIVIVSANSLSVRDNFDHLIGRSMACTLEDDFGYAR